MFCSCTSCRGSSGSCALKPKPTAFDELTLESAVIAGSNGQPRSIPYNSAASNLCQKVTTPCGSAVMSGPLNGTLEDAQKDRIRR